MQVFPGGPKAACGRQPVGICYKNHSAQISLGSTLDRNSSVEQGSNVPDCGSFIQIRGRKWGWGAYSDREDSVGGS